MRDQASGRMPPETELPTGFEPIDVAALPPTARSLKLSAPSALQTCTNIRPDEVRGRSKRIVICADGTWNTPRNLSGEDPAPTNVWLMYQLVKDEGGDGLPQLAYYHAGVGTRRFERARGGMLGWGIKRNILECYRFLVENYKPGDRIYLFGFSRGAYTVRSLAGLLRNSGIVDPGAHSGADAVEGAIQAAYTLYRGRGDDTAPVAPRALEFRALHSHPDFRIAGIGVWDTVGALGIPVGGPVGWLSGKIFGFHDVTLSTTVDVALHAVAVDERRGPFLPTLWVQQRHAAAEGQVLEQVWFPGVHSDVGGGYGWREREFANITLRWMVKRLSALTLLDLDLGLVPPARPTGVAIHDSLAWYYTLPPLTRPITRVIDAGLWRKGLRDGGRATSERLHESVEWCVQEYSAVPLPTVHRPYSPETVADLAARLAEESGRTPPEPYPSDRRMPVQPG